MPNDHTNLNPQPATMGDVIGGGIRQGLRTMSGWDALNNAIGYAAGAALTGKLIPDYADAQGNVHFTGAGSAGFSPKALGSTIIEGNQGITRTEQDHEGRHANQSRLLGPAYLPAAAFGGDLGQLEHDAYTATEPKTVGGESTINMRRQFGSTGGRLVDVLRNLLGAGFSEGR